MGGGIYYEIHKGEKNEKRASEFAAGALWLMAIASVFSTFLVFALNRQLLMLLGASGEMLALGEEYIAIIALGAGLQVTGTGLVPFIRNHGGSFYAMAAMIAGFVTNIILDYCMGVGTGRGRRSTGNDHWARDNHADGACLFAAKKAGDIQPASVTAENRICIHPENRDCTVWACHDAEYFADDY